MYKTVVFDVDGTLIDTEKAVLHSLQKAMLKGFGQHIPMTDLHFALGITGAHALRALGVPEAQIDATNDLWNDSMVAFKDEISVFRGITETLAALKNMGIPMGIVTSKTHLEVVHDFNPMGISHFFDFEVNADDTQNHKPHPDPLRKYLDRSGFRPEEVLYIGDTIYDAQCAQSAGIDFGIALWGAKNPSNIEAAWSFESPEQILTMLLLV